MMAKVVGLVSICLALSGCVFKVPSNTLMVHPKSGDVQECKAFFGGAVIYPVWQTSGECIKQFQALGYKKAVDLTPKERDSLRPELRKFEFKGEIKNR